MSVSGTVEAGRVVKMLRTIKDGDRVAATIHAPVNRQGMKGTVIESNHQLGDGVRRIKVRWDDGYEVATMPTSIVIE